MKNLILSIFVLLFCNIISNAQKESNNWYFGNHAGLNFDPGNPVAVSNGSLNMQEGCSAVSDSEGNLLFYTDGMHVWNKNHIQMSNGFDLGGAPSSTSTAIIPKPGNGAIYYIISVDENVGTKGLSFSVIDMQLNGGLGDVVEENKSIPLFTPASEKIAVTQHENGIDYWLIVHKWDSDEFVSYLVNESGIQITSPIISPRGTVYEGHVSNSRGYIKVSPQGDKLVAAIEGMSILEMFDFDNATGVISNHVKFPGVYKSAYGLEFSIDGKYLYCSERWGNKVYQFNLAAGTLDAVFASETVIGNNGVGMQLGMDGRIYLASGSSALSVINNPVAAGTESNYLANNFSLYKQSYEGLPSFISSYFSGLKFTYQKGCPGEATFFKILNPEGIQSVEWFFNYPSNDAFDKSTSLTPEYVYEPGTYKIRLVANYADRTESAEQTIQIDALPELDLPTSKEICFGDFIEVNGFSYYEWSDGSRSNKLYPKTSGSYWLKVKDKRGCSLPEQKKSIDITVNTRPTITYTKNNVSTLGGNDGSIDITVSNGTEPLNYFWYSGETSEDLNNLSVGNYIVNVIDSKQCSSRESVAIEGPLNCEATSNEWSQLIYSEMYNSTGMANDINVDDFGNLYIIGHAGKEQVYSGIYHATKGTFDRLLAKFDNEGKLIWIKTFVYDISFSMRKVEIDKEGNVFVLGHFNGTIDIDGLTLTSLEDDDMFLAKFSKSGQLIWARRAGGASKEQAFDLAVDNIGNAYTLCRYSGSVNMADTILTSSGYDDIFLAKYNIKGDIEWVRSFGGTSTEYGASISINQSNIIFIAGRTGSLNCEFDGLIVDARCYIAQYSTEGTILNLIKLPNTTYDLHIVVRNNDMFLSGDFDGVTEFGQFTLLDPTYNYSRFIAKLTIDGNYCWAKQVCSSESASSSDFFVDSMNNLYLLGYLWADANFEGNFIPHNIYPDSHNNPSMYIVKFNQNSDLIYVNNIDVSAGIYTNVWAPGFCVDKMQNVFVAGAMSYGVKFGNLSAPINFSGLFIAKYSDNKLKVNIPETNLGCSNLNSTLDLMTSGGTKPYSYLWYDGQTTPSIDISIPGNYGVTVIDANSCVATDSIVVSISSGISLKAIIVNASSCRSKDGEINLIVIGGEAPYTYQWSNGSTSEDLYNLAPGEYSVDVTDKNGCTATSSAIVTKSDNPIQLVLKGIYDCAGSNNGSIDLTINGGNGDLQIQWSNGAITEDISGLTAGWYFVTVQDDSFIASDSILLDAENVMQTKFKVKNDCENASDGKIDLDVSGGKSPYSFLWSTNETTQNIKNLVAGVYDVIVTDDNGCKAYDTAEVFIAYLPNQANAIKGMDAVCLSEEEINIFSTTTVDKASYYDWQVVPAEAGNISGDGTKSKINWNEYYVGDVAVMVSGRNSCGNGKESDPLNIKILNPTIKINCSETIPIGDSILMSFELAGTPPWQFQYSDGTDSFFVETDNNPFQTWISKAGVYKIESLIDANCRGFNLGNEVEVKLGLTSFENLNFDDYVTVFPNPTKGFLSLSVNNPFAKPIKIEIVSMKGTKIYSKEFFSAKTCEEINLYSYAKGIYNLNLIIENKIQSVKLILQ